MNNDPMWWRNDPPDCDRSGLLLATASVAAWKAFRRDEYPEQIDCIAEQFWAIRKGYSEKPDGTTVAE